MSRTTGSGRRAGAGPRECRDAACLDRPETSQKDDEGHRPDRAERGLLGAERADRVVSVAEGGPICDAVAGLRPQQGRELDAPELDSREPGPRPACRRGFPRGIREVGQRGWRPASRRSGRRQPDRGRTGARSWIPRMRPGRRYQEQRADLRQRRGVEEDPGNLRPFFKMRRVAARELPHHWQ